MKLKLLPAFLLSALSPLLAQTTDPMITSWVFNTTNQTFTGTGGTAVVDVEGVYYTSSLVYVKTSGIPNYYEDGISHFDAVDQTSVLKLPRTQTVGTSATRTSIIEEGAVGVFLNGVAALSPGDGKTYNSEGIWHQLAYKFEGLDFDSYNGHSTPGGQYHNHVDPKELYDENASSVHSPIVGYAFDGYPIYGPYAYTNTNGTGAIKRMESSWATRNISTRTTLPDGSTASSSGPSVGLPPSGQPLGKYWEDYEFVSGSGDLDRYNGRFCVTPEYPSGIYCYFITLDASLEPYFPYIIGDSLYGVVEPGNTGPTGGNNTVPGSATEYDPLSTSASDAVFENIGISVFPNPSSELLNVTLKETGNYKVIIYNANGNEIESREVSSSVSFNVSGYSNGNYVVEVVNNNSGNGYMKRVVVMHK